jgi:hypothetical protein
MIGENTKVVENIGGGKEKGASCETRTRNLQIESLVLLASKAFEIWRIACQHRAL